MRTDYTIPQVVVPTEPHKLRAGYGLERSYRALVPQDNAPGKWVTVRIVIQRDAYDFQSVYRADFLTGNGWQPLVSIPNQAEDMVALPPYVAWDLKRQTCIDACEQIAGRLVDMAYRTLRPF